MRDWWVLSTRDIVKEGDKIFFDGRWRKISHKSGGSLIGKPANDTIVCRPKVIFQVSGKVVLASKISNNGFFRKMKGEYVYKKLGYTKIDNVSLNPNYIYGIAASGSIASVKNRDKVVQCNIKDFFDVYNYKMTSGEVDGSKEADHIAKRIMLAGE